MSMPDSPYYQISLLPNFPNASKNIFHNLSLPLSYFRDHNYFKSQSYIGCI